MARAEDLVGGFATVYRTLRAIEESGRIRRGWFVGGLSGAQFAVPGAVDALRASDGRVSGKHGIVVLAAADPAQPFGALLPWPQGPEEEDGSKERGRPRRVVGAHVCVVDGEPMWWLSASRKQLIVFPSAEAATECETGLRLERAFEALAALPRKGRRRLGLETVDGVDATDGPTLSGCCAAASRASTCSCQWLGRACNSPGRPPLRSAASTSRVTAAWGTVRAASPTNSVRASARGSKFASASSP